MSAESVLNEDTMSASLQADGTDDSCVFKYIEIVPLTTDTDGRNTTECDSRDWSAQVKEENLPVVMQKPQDVHVCCIVLYSGRRKCVLCCKSSVIFYESKWSIFMSQSGVISFCFIPQY